MQACDRCHRRKSKCDKQVPVCGPCVKAGAACGYTDRSKEPTYRKEVVERLEKRLRQTEATNRALAARLANTGNSNLPAHAASGDDVEEDSSAATRSPSRQHGSRPDTGNDVTDEVSFLSLNAGGDRQFLGSGSGVLFANLVRATVNATSASSPTTPAVGASAGAPSMAPRKRDFTDAFHGDDSYASGTRDSPSLGRTACPQFPPEVFARQMHHGYFSHDHLAYPFLHRPTVLAAFEKIYTDISYLDRDVYAYFVFYMILAISSVDFHKFDWRTRPDAENFHCVALSRLNEVLQLGGIKALQSVLLLCQYRMRSSIQDTSASMWHLVGIAARMSFELGLHREPLYQVREGHDQHGADTEPFVWSEIRRRCFYCVVAIDRVVSINLGRPLAIRLEDIDVALPDPQFDLDVNPPDSNFQPISTETFSRTEVFVHIVRYRIICGKILVSLHNGLQKAHQLDEASAVASRDRLATELEEWRRETAALHLPAVDLSSAIPGDRSSFRAHEWYELLYHNALLMLYRPLPELSPPNSKPPSIIRSIFKAAKQSITLYAHLHRSRRINYTWITLHAIFMAGLSYVYAVGRHFRAKRCGFSPGEGAPMLDEDPTIIEIVNETRACSNVLVAVSERWSGCHNSHEVFHRLSDAVLADAIELLSNKTNQPPNPFSQKGDSRTSLPATAAEGVSSARFESWAVSDVVPNPPLAVDSVLRDCFQDLQHMHEHSYGDDPIGRLSQDWLGEIGGMALEAVQVWGE